MNTQRLSLNLAMALLHTSQHRSVVNVERVLDGSLSQRNTQSRL